MYSLTPILPQQHQSQAPVEQKLTIEGNPKPEFIKPPETPTLWFNPATQRWISTSCRVYREILRDKALVQSGLPPGPRRKKRKVRKVIAANPTPQESLPPIQKTCTTQTFVQQPQPLSDRERRDALFARYGM